MARIHDTLRDILFMMCKAAGLTVVKEPLGLLGDNADEKPGDIYITGWNIKGCQQTSHAIDCTFPLVDSDFKHLSVEQKLTRSTVVGATAREFEERKRSMIGTAAEQRARGNADTMEKRCKAQNIHFWPVAMEGDGVPSDNFLGFINHVSDAAQKLKEANRATFKAYFSGRIANTLHQISAKLALKQTAACRSRLVHRPGPLEIIHADVDFEQELQTVVPGYVSKRREWRNRNSNQGVRLRGL
jgi:hypothetical protein